MGATPRRGLPEDLPAEVRALCEELLRVKHAKGLSLDAMARAGVGFSRSSWARALKGRTLPPRAAVENLAVRHRLDRERLLRLWDAAHAARLRHLTGLTPDVGPERPATPPRTRDATTESRTGAATPPAAPGTPPAAGPAGTPGAPSRTDTGGPTPAGTPAGPATPARPEASRDGHPTASPRPTRRRRLRPAWLAVLALALLVPLVLLVRWYQISQVEGEDTADAKASAPPTHRAHHGPSPEGDTVRSTGQPPDAPLRAEQEERSLGSRRETGPSVVEPGVAGKEHCDHSSDRSVVLARGMGGDPVKEVQCLLVHNYAFDLEVDGIFGDATEVAVKVVQRCSGLRVDGLVGPRTWHYLDRPEPGCGH